MPLAEGISQDFMDRFSAWVRLESRCRSNDLSLGIQARIADPLWMLARQWQFGEFIGEDTGSPIRLECSYMTQPINTFTTNGEVQSYNSADIPLETLVEREIPKFDWQSRVRIGQEWERLVQAAFPDQAADIIDLFRKKYSLSLPENEEWDSLDYATRKFLEFMHRRVTDSKKLLDAYSNSVDSLPVYDNPSNPLNTSIKDIIEELFKKYQEQYEQPDTETQKAWRSSSLDYRFRLNQLKADEDPTTKKTSLIAANYRNGDLDWYIFSTDGPVTEKWTKHRLIIRTPNRISIGGTSLRWWAFENAETDYGALDVAKPDLAKLALMEFALVYGDDWYSVPIPAKMCNLVRVDKLRVYNVFNEYGDIKPARKVAGSQNKRWDLYSLCRFQDRDKVPNESILFIPPVAGFREESKPLEEVHFLRDENANMVWAIEHKILNSMGQPIDGFESQLERIKRRNQVEIRVLKSDIADIRKQLETEVLSDEVRSELKNDISEKLARIEKLERGFFAQDKPQNNAQLCYRLATKVPENWFPYIPVNVPRLFEPILLNAATVPPPTILRLKRAQMLRNTDDEEPTFIPAFSRLLDDDTDPLLWIDENAIGRDGLRLLLTKQRVRWIGGKTFVWLGRKVLTGKGEGSSGLRFDVINYGSTKEKE